MLAKSLSAIALACGLAAVLFVTARAQDAFVGSWVLDPAASTAPPGAAPTAGTLEITNAGGGQFTYVSETTVGGMNVHTEITFSVDGKDYAVTATPAAPGTPPITQSIEQVSATLYKISIKIGGQEMMTGTSEISGDGKTLTQKATGVGQLTGLSSTSVYRRK